MSSVSHILFPSSKYNGILAGVYCSITGIAGYYTYKNLQSNAIEDSPINSNLFNVEQAFLDEEELKSADDAINICGRIKCMKPNETTNLSNKHEPFSFIIGSCGLYNLSKYKSDYDKLILLGFTKEWIELQLYNGNQFNLYLFPEKSNNYKATLAKWDGIFELIKINEPEIHKKIVPFIKELKDTPFEDIEAKSDFEFLDVDELGQNDKRYLTKQRFLEIKQDDLTLVDVRFFLYSFMGLTKYFDGDGYSVDQYGNKGCKQYLIKNIKLNEINNIKIIELNVQIPNTNNQ